MADPVLVVDPETVAKRAGLDPTDDNVIDVVTDAILDAQDDVRAYLGRVIVPTLATEHGRYADGAGRWVLAEHDDEPPRVVVQVTPEMVDGQVTGLFTVTYQYGIDARQDEFRPIARYVKAHALNSPEVTRLWESTVKARGPIKSVSAEGQSISWEKATLSGGAAAKPGDGTPGALPVLGSLDLWRLRGRRVHVAPSRSSDWPFTGRRW